MQQGFWQRAGWLAQTWLIGALGVLIAAHTSLGGISYDSALALFVAVVLLSFLNAVLGPMLILLALPFVILTLGLGILVINAGLFLLAGWLVQGFHVGGFLPALWGALVMGVTTMAAHRAFGRPTLGWQARMGRPVDRARRGDDDPPRPPGGGPPRRPPPQVIDVDPEKD